MTYQQNFTATAVCVLSFLIWLSIFLQDKVVNSISELYSFMDGADATLARKVLGEGGEEEGIEATSPHTAEEDAEAGEQ